ncbi:hypothetical protein [Propionivibrio sp.]|uniref:hypothetical protein n=1 Tax=Propionivibrio sp. TaxID=2212460 RepID=UPI00261A8056|nr:hypothetical protein [Propionivibrio sp.]
MTDIISLARRLSQASSYALRIEPLAHRIPDLMESNDQLRPLWDTWRQQAAPNVAVEKVFTKEQLRILRSFFEHLYFASDAFARSVGKRP